jgi:hypothetical protein
VTLLADGLQDLAPNIAATPRRAKRFVNTLRLCHELARTSGEDVDDRSLAVVLAIALRWPRLVTNFPALSEMWSLAFAPDPESRERATRLAADELELLDPELVILLLAQETPPTLSDLARLVGLVRGVTPDSQA